MMHTAATGARPMSAAVLHSSAQGLTTKRHGAFPKTSKPLHKWQITATEAPAQEAFPQEVEKVWKDLEGQAKDALNEATQRISNVQQAQDEAARLRWTAETAQRIATEAQAEASRLVPAAETAIQRARQAALALRGQPQELTMPFLHDLAASQLRSWLATQEDVSAFQEVSETEAGIAGLHECYMVAHTALAIVKGRQYALAALAAGERQQEGNLAGLTLHWGCVRHEGESWGPPPAGWHTIPDRSYGAGKAWQTPLGMLAPVMEGVPVASCAAHAVVLQLPLEGMLQGGGISAVLKRPEGVHPEWLTRDQNRNFFVSFAEVWKLAQDGKVMSASATSAQPTDRYRGPNRARRYEEAKLERRRRQEEKRAAAAQAGQKSASGADTPEAPGSASASPEMPEEQVAAIEDWVSHESMAMPTDTNGTLIQEFTAALQLLQMVSDKGNGVIKDGAAERTQSTQQAFEEAGQLVVDAEQAQEEAAAARQEADRLSRQAEEAEANALAAQEGASAAVRGARQAGARLRGKDNEVGIADLHAVAAARLAGWSAWVASRNSMDESIQDDTDGEAGDEGFKPMTAGFRLEGIQGSMVAHVGHAFESGRHCALVVLVCSEAFPEGLLDGAVFHWAVASREGGTWSPPPDGWQSDPSHTSAAGEEARQTAFEAVQVPGYARRTDIAVHALTLQLPLEGKLLRGGVTGVIKTAHGRWLHCQQHGAAPDFHISTREVGDYAESLSSSRNAKQTETAFSDGSAEAAPPERPDWTPDMLSGFAADKLVMPLGGLGTDRSEGHPAQWMVDDIIGQEPKAERSLMHRFNIALGLVEAAVTRDDYDAALIAIAVWLRFSAARHLTWNRNYNVKPREIGAAQDRLTSRLAVMLDEGLGLRDTLRLCLVTVGRGGQGDVGQRIRDEILHVQAQSNAKGGMMEEWHQKLHNNTSPDDVIICQALLDYIDSGLDISTYWATLKAANISKERLASFDRPIQSEPNFSKEQCPGLKRDLSAYLQTLKAVHCGADLQSAAATVMGYQQAAVKGKAILVDPVPNAATDRLKRLLQDCLLAQALQAKGMLKGDLQGLLWGLSSFLMARRELLPFIQDGNKGCGGRLRDLLYLDLALESAVRSLLESSMADIRAASAEAVHLPSLLQLLSASLEHTCMAFASNQELVLCLKDLQGALGAAEPILAMRATAAAERLRRALADLSVRFTRALQPTAEALGQGLQLSDEVIQLFSEEVIRGTAAAPLSQLLTAVEPQLRSAAGLSAWQVVSPAHGRAAGRLEIAEQLRDVQHSRYMQPTVLLVDRVGGEEDVPEGCVGLVTPDALDVLSHAAVRARNSSVLLASCSDAAALQGLRVLAGRDVELTLSQGTSEVTWTESSGVSPAKDERKAPSKARIESKSWCGTYAVASSNFDPGAVGAKSLNTAALRVGHLQAVGRAPNATLGKLPEWIHTPDGVAIPFGALDAVLEDEVNADVSVEFVKAAGLAGNADANLSNLESIKGVIQKLRAPDSLRQQLRRAFMEEGLAWEDGQWEASWAAIKRVWASKWNERAVLSLRRAGLSHSALQMAVLCQAVVPAQYAFVAHTTNPMTGDKEQMYIELVQGLGETIVGNWPGCALSYTAEKAHLPSLAVASAAPESFPDGLISIRGFCSKSHALRPAEGGSVIIFRSDSNGEDLEGYAGAGLFDSVQSSAPQEVPVEFSSDPLLADLAFQSSVLGRIAAASAAVERAAGSPQDIEGAITANGKLYIVQTRPQV